MSNTDETTVVVDKELYRKLLKDQKILGDLRNILVWFQMVLEGKA